MLKIRLQRVGRKHDPSYRVVLIDSQRGPKSGNFVENLGFYDAIRKVKQIKADRVKHWIENGAQVSDTVHNILVSEKVIEGKKKNVLPKKSPVVNEAKLKAEAEAKEKAEAKIAEEKAAAEAPVEEVENLVEATENKETAEEVVPEEAVEDTTKESSKEEVSVEEVKK